MQFFWSVCISDRVGILKWFWNLETSWKFYKRRMRGLFVFPKESNQMILFSLYHFRRPNETNWSGLPTIILKRKSWKTNHKLRKRISFGSWHMSKLLSNEQGGRWVKPPTTYLPCRWRLKYWVLQWINLCLIMSYYFTDPLGESFRKFFITDRKTWHCNNDL